MTVEVIGLLTILAGIVALMLGRGAVPAMLVFTTLFGAAAATIIGAANIQPAYLLLVFLSLTALTRRREGAAALAAIAPFKAGFWLTCLVVFGIVGSFTLPQLLAQTTAIIPLGTGQYADTGSAVPLGPVSSNLTQSIYLAGNLLCFILVAAVASGQRGFMALTAGLLAYCIGNAAFAFIDLVTYFTGTQDILTFMRNSSYVMHHQEQIGGLKRIVGSFTEASVFARSTLGALGFSGTLWLCGYRSSLTGPLAAVSLALVVLSTSSAGLAGVVPVMGVLYLTALGRCGVGAKGRNSAAMVLFAPPLMVLIAIGVMLYPTTAAIVMDYADAVIFTKAETASGVERAAWNTAAYQNFVDTWGIGVGLGTARASSFALALLSNLGIVGAVLYLLFVGTAFMPRRLPRRTIAFDVRLAARNACVGLIVGDLMIGTTVDQGLIFYVLAAVASTQPEEDEPEFEPQHARELG